ncbi:rcc01693 family protein [Oceanicella sp. SM1341]|uniref:rcc01693 family protein n=1 Tax=Oceanicella sp. SM1341 TaxID=1548889 RepID=UPI000E502643|nr:rcc01693 family protein [Oceanicella sp. SM1341]
MAERVAWARLMRLGMVQLGLAPERFWALTPAELFLLAGLDDGSAQGMTRGALEALEARFPDRPNGERSDG